MAGAQRRPGRAVIRGMDTMTLLLPERDGDPAGPDCDAYLDGLAAGLTGIGVTLRRVRLGAAGGAAALADIVGPVVIPDAALGMLAAGAAREAMLRRAAVLVLQPLPHALAITPMGAALRDACWVAAASPPLQATLLRELPGLAADAPLLPGSMLADRVAAEPSEAGCRLLSLGAPGTLGHQTVVIDALAGLRDLDWQLAIEVAPDDPDGAAIDSAIEDHRLGDRVTRLDVVDDLDWRRADCFVRAGRAGCLSGSALQALRRGIPLALTAPVVVAPPQAGVVAPMDDAEALSRSLRRIICDQRLRGALADGAFSFAQGLPDWATQARRLCDHLASGGGARARGVAPGPD